MPYFREVFQSESEGTIYTLYIRSPESLVDAGIIHSHTVWAQTDLPLLEGLFGRTPGKRLSRLRVVRDGGVAIGMKEAFLRRISMYLKILTIDALFIPFNAKKQRAFDMVAKTVVIHEPGV